MSIDGWWIENNPGEQRAALMEQGQLVALRLVRARSGPRAGEIYGARLRNRISPQRAVLDLGGDNEALIQPIPDAAEGSFLAIEITRSERDEPGRLKPAQARLAPDRSVSRLGLVSPRPDEFPGVQTIASFPAEWGVEEALDQALAGTIPFPSGALTFERTAVGLILDVDGAGDPVAVNSAAAQAVARLLRLYGVGGSVLVDFITVAGKAERLAVAQAYDEAAACDPTPFERTAVNGFGLMQIVRPRPDPSVLDLLCGTRRQGPSAETRALRLLREARHAQGAGPRRLVAAPAVAALLEIWQEEREALARRVGAPVQVIADPTQTDYGYVHVTPL